MRMTEVMTFAGYNNANAVSRAIDKLCHNTGNMGTGKGYYVECKSMLTGMEPFPYHCVLHALMAMRDEGKNKNAVFICPRGLTSEQLLETQVKASASVKY